MQAGRRGHAWAHALWLGDGATLIGVGAAWWLGLVDGVHVTKAAVSVLDAVGELGLTAGADLMDRCLLRKRVTLGTLRSAYRVGMGSQGWAVAARLLALAAGDALLDLAFHEQRVLVEVDGWAHHRDVDAFRRDRARQNALVLDGWTVVRVTSHDLVDRPEQVLAWVRAALAG